MKNLLLTLLLIWVSFSLQAQWVSQSANLSFTGNIYKIDIVDPNIVWVITTSNELLRTTNGGNTWVKTPFSAVIGTSNAFLTCITATDANTAWMTVRDDGNSTTIASSSVFKTINGGQAWTKQPSAYDQNSWACNIHFFDSNNGVTMGDSNGAGFEIYTTSNGGNTWIRVPSSNLPAPVSNQDFGLGGNLFSVHGNTIWIGVGGRRILKSVDKGISWTISNTGLLSQPVNSLPKSIAFKDALNGLVMGNSELRQTNDGGITWSTVNSTGPLKSYVTNVPGTINTYISTGSGISGLVGSSYSNDGGLTWNSLENVISHNQATFISPTTGWSGTSNNLHKFNSSILGLKSALENKAQFKLYPNPSAGIFHILPSSTKPFDLEIYDLVGNKVMQQQGQNLGNNLIDLSGEKKGVYFLNILSDGQRIIEKIIIL